MKKNLVVNMNNKNHITCHNVMRFLHQDNMNNYGAIININIFIVPEGEEEDSEPSRFVRISSMNNSGKIINQSIQIPKGVAVLDVEKIIGFLESKLREQAGWIK